MEESPWKKGGEYTERLASQLREKQVKAVADMMVRVGQEAYDTAADDLFAVVDDETDYLPVIGNVISQLKQASQNEKAGDLLRALDQKTLEVLSNRKLPEAQRRLAQRFQHERSSYRDFLSRS